MRSTNLWLDYFYYELKFLCALCLPCVAASAKKGDLSGEKFQSEHLGVMFQKINISSTFFALQNTQKRRQNHTFFRKKRIVFCKISKNFEIFPAPTISKFYPS